MNTQEIESSIRQFMSEELMFEQADEITLDEDLTLDSLDQTELRVFLSDTFKIDTTLENVPAEKIGTLKDIISLIESQSLH
ncbi:MAG: hypothetical protein KDF59_08175 [Nitrosomonas sp.]|nr:hypothetical protein [Nitrosomonas sp.]